MNTNTERMRKLKHHLYWEISQENKIHFQKKLASCLSVGHAALTKVKAIARASKSSLKEF